MYVSQSIHIIIIRAAFHTLSSSMWVFGIVWGWKCPICRSKLVALFDS